MGTRFPEALERTSHRGWPLPSSPWVMEQAWNRFLLAHWPVSLSALRRVVPPELPLDSYDGQCWLGVVPFDMDDIRFRGMPRVPGARAFPELNVRTYVKVNGKPGVYFLSLDAQHWPAVRTARAWFGLPYMDAVMHWERDRDGTVHYRSQRVHRGAPPADFDASYRPTGPAAPAEPGTFAHWAAERYALYVVRDGAVLRGDVAHLPWQLSPAEAEIRVNTMARSHGIELPDTEPHLLFSERAETVLWPLRRPRALPPPVAAVALAGP